MADFNALTRYLDTLPQMNIPGCGLTVSLNHKVVYRHLAGEGRPGCPIDGTETYWLYSTSKLYTMTCAMQLIEQGKIHLNDPVSLYLPAYEHLSVRDGDSVRPARTVLTIEHLMSMQGGLNYDLQMPSILACLERCDTDVTTRQIADAIAENPLDFDPGTHFQYSLCHDVMGAVIEAASGLSFGEYLEKNIVRPLGIPTLTFHPTEEQLSRMEACYEWDDEGRCTARDRLVNPYIFGPRYESGGAGLLSDLDSYALLPDALANDGVGASGARILSRASIDEMRRDRLSPVSRADFDGMEKKGYSYGLGVRTLTDADSSRSPVGEFGWDGAAATWTMIDPDHHLSAFYVQHVHNCQRAYLEVHPAIRDLIYEALEL